MWAGALSASHANIFRADCRSLGRGRFGGRVLTMDLYNKAMHFWDDLPVRTKGLVVVALPLSALLATTVLIYGANRQGTEAAALARHILAIYGEIRNIRESLTESQASIKGYLISGEEADLGLYERNRKELPPKLDHLALLVEDNPGQTARVRAVQAEVLHYLATLDGTRLLHATEPDRASAQQMLRAESDAMAKLRLELRAMLDAEDALLPKRKNDYASSRLNWFLSLGLSLGLGCLASVVGMMLFSSGISKRIQRLEQSAKLLESGVPLTESGWRKDELGRLGQTMSNSSVQLVASRQTIRHQVNLLESMVSSISDGVIVADQQGKFVIFNPAAEEILGTGPSEIPLERWQEHYGVFLADGQPVPASDLPLARALRGEAVNGVELLVRRPDWAQPRWISVSGRPLVDNDGQGSGGGVVVFRDVTEDKRTEERVQHAKEEAERANQAKSEFLSRMSHELRTPLNSILGFAQILHMGQLSGRTLECVEHILKSGKHLLGLIDEVLDISRIEAGRLALSPEPVLLSEAIHQALDMVRPIADQFGIELINGISPDCQQHVTADRQRLQQVVLNIVSNAIKYNLPHGKVTVSFKMDPFGRVRLNVTDTGLGIAPGDQLRLFVPFERLSAGQTDIQGTGLGLALSKRLIESMDGSMGVESQLGSGSTFWIELPAVEAPTERVDREGSLANLLVQPLDGSRTVLYVEDNLSNVRLMEHVLSYRPQVRLLVAMQGQMGIDLALEHLPDLIFLDLHLPDLSGDKVLLQLRSDRRTRHIPMVMISADATAGQIRRLLEAGATDYLTKPLDVERLLRILDESVQGSSKTAGLSTTQSSSVVEAVR